MIMLDPNQDEGWIGIVLVGFVLMGAVVLALKGC